MTKANRIVLVDETGRVYDRTGVSIELHEQDDGLTLKVFVTALPTEEAGKAAADHAVALGQDLVNDMALVPDMARRIREARDKHFPSGE